MNISALCAPPTAQAPSAGRLPGREGGGRLAYCQALSIFYEREGREEVQRVCWGVKTLVNIRGDGWHVCITVMW